MGYSNPPNMIIMQKQENLLRKDERFEIRAVAGKDYDLPVSVLILKFV